MLASQRLSLDEGLTLFRTPDLFTLGELANTARERLHGRKAYYNIHRHINCTHFCVLRCKFCAFYRPYAEGNGNAANGYELLIDEIAELASEAGDRRATEVQIVGGLHPKLPFSY